MIQQNVPEDRFLHLFKGYGVELEYMIVDRRTLNILSLADKILVSSSLIMMISHGWVPGWMGCIIIGRELVVTGLRGVVAGSGEDVSSSVLAKYKTGFQIAAIIPLLFHYPYFGIDFQCIGILFLWGALFLTVWSAIDYFIRHRRLFAD